MEITGRDGVDIRERVGGRPRGLPRHHDPGFPNLFMSYGPNTGSLDQHDHLPAREAGRLHPPGARARGGDGRCRRRPPRRPRPFNARVQARLRKTVFTTGCPGWYTTDAGKVTTVWAGSHVAYAKATRAFVPTEFEQVYASRTPAVANV